MGNSESATLKPRRRWFQYSLRSFLILLTALAVWLGVVVNRAREQREAVKAIEAMGGVAIYDWQLEGPPLGDFIRNSKKQPDGPAWLRGLIGDEFFQEVNLVLFTPSTQKAERDFVNSVPNIRGLRAVRSIILFGCTEKAQIELMAALPNCEVILATVD